MCASPVPRRDDGVVYVFDISTGDLVHTIGSSASSAAHDGHARASGHRPATIHFEVPRGLLLVRAPADGSSFVESNTANVLYLVVAERRRIQLLRCAWHMWEVGARVMWGLHRGLRSLCRRRRRGCD